MTNHLIEMFREQMITENKRGETGFGYSERHNRALVSPSNKEKMLLNMIYAWASYAAGYHAEYGSLIGDDHFMGPSWEKIGNEIHSNMLSMEIGNLDGGTLSGFILSFAKSQNAKDLG